MTHTFRLFWRRETGCDAGTPVGLEDLDPVIRARVDELAHEDADGECMLQQSAKDEGPIAIRLPFLDRREARRRSEALRHLRFVREGRVIRYVPANASAALRDQAAEVIGAHPVWLAAPSERTRGYFLVWRDVSVALQEYLRRAVPEIYFRDPARYENRRIAWPLLVYQALRPCRGLPQTEFTFDIAKPEMLTEALRLVRRPLQEILGDVQVRLAESGRGELSRRYAPMWQEDIVRAVQERPRRLLGALGDEAALVDAVITLGAARNLGMVKPFVRQVMATLRSFYDCDLRELAAPLLVEATQALERTMQSSPHKTDRSTGRIARVIMVPVASRSPVISRSPRVTSGSPPVKTGRAYGAPDTSGRYKPGSEAFR